MFFKKNHTTPTENLRLKDFDQIWTKFCFLDETGSLDNPKDPFFTIGILKLSQPYYLAGKLHYERSKRRFYDEMKFNKLSKNNIEFAKIAIGSLFDVRSTHFYSYTVDKNGPYFSKEFSGDSWLAYEKITMRLIKDAVLAPQEILILIADYVPTPDNVRYEVSVKKNINKALGRLALAGVCRFDSRSNDLLQLVDLIIGAINYDLKLTYKIIPPGNIYKKEIVDFLKSNLGITTFADGFRNRHVNIFVDKDSKMRSV